MNARPRPTRSSTHHPHLRRLTGAIAIIVAGGCGGPQSTPTPGATSLDVSARTGAPIVADSVRGVDPSTVGAPLYLISMSVETDNTANISSLVYYKNGGPNNPNLSTFAPADQLRVGIEAVIGRNGGLVEGPDPVTCQVGDWRDGGDLGPGLWTSPGGLYTACMKNPDRPDVVGKPIAFNAPTQVGMTDQLYLYARLEVLDAGEVWGPGSDPTAGVSGALNGLGGAFNVLGAFTAFTPVGAIAKGVGTFMQMVGQYTAPSAHGPVPACLISDTLVPGFGPNDPPSDTGSPLVRVPLDGRQLYELTARGDAAVAYDSRLASVPADDDVPEEPAAHQDPVAHPPRRHGRGPGRAGDLRGRHHQRQLSRRARRRRRRLQRAGRPRSARRRSGAAAGVGDRRRRSLRGAAVARAHRDDSREHPASSICSPSRPRATS